MNSPTPAPAIPSEGEALAEMTPEEHRLEGLKQMAVYAGPIVSFDVREPYYLASCDHCGWVGSSELCGTDSYGDDSDCYCPRCQASGADCGKVAERLGAPSAEVARLTAALGEAVALAGDVRWQELGRGAEFTVIDRVMLRDMFNTATRLTPHRSPKP